MPDPRRLGGLALASVVAMLGGCAEDTVASIGAEEVPPAMAVGETRNVELRYMRLDVEGFKNELTLEELRAMPRRILQDVWLADLDITQLMVNSLVRLRELSDDEVAELGQPAQNMRRLLLFTPDNAVLDGTKLEELVALSAAVGIPPAKALANLFGTEVTGDFIPPEIVAEVMLDLVVGSHPNAQLRRGPVDAEHPDGMWPVAPRAVPLTLADVITNFEDMAERFGPAGDHPGFVAEARGITVIEEDFRMSTLVNANALPFKGLDLTNASVASVNSIAAQIETAHDYSDPDWIQIEGLVEDPRVERLTFTVLEHDEWVPGGETREPLPFGSSPAWDLEPWIFERLISQMAQVKALEVPAHCDTYELGTGADAFTACIDETGWVELTTFNDVGSPPPPAYLWDLDLEIAQVRLHDGGLAEGEADIELTINDVAVGVSPEELIEQTRKNLELHPAVLAEFASLITDSTVGDADFYYYRPPVDAAAADQGDWLYFVVESDLRLDDEGHPVRDYAYDAPGFFADADLSEKISSVEEVDGDELHEKVRIVPGDELYAQDDEGNVFRLIVGDKPGRARVTLDVTRVR
jgi:hypothetical protein